jgi:hypothetical protein
MHNSNQEGYTCLFEHYENCFKLKGDCVQGVDWPNETDAALRYDIMMDILAHDRHCPSERCWTSVADWHTCTNTLRGSPIFRVE